MRLTFLDCVLFLLFNVITSFFYQNEGKGMGVPSPIDMHCKLAVTFHRKGLGETK